MSQLLVAQRALTIPGWAKDALWRGAQAVPSLDLRFADNKSLVDAVTGQQLVTHTRASSGTFVGSDGVLQTATTNEPRFDHNPTTGESLGLLVEEARTNLLLRSEEFTEAIWQLFGTTSRSANVVTAPNGTLTADSVTLPISSGIFQSAATTAGITLTFSIYIRCDTTQTVRILINTNLSDPTVKTVTATTAWQRFDVTKTTSVGTTSYSAQLDTGNGNTFYLWGAQLEAGAFPTSYIPTTTAAATHAADVASSSGTNFSSFYNQTEGTVFAEATASPNISTSYVAISNGTTSQNSTYFDNDTGIIRSVTFSASSAVSVLGLGSIGTVGTGNKLTSAYKANDFAAARNGGTVQTDTSGAVPVSVTQLDIGRNPNAASAAYLSGTIKRLTYWPVRLADPTLVSITQP